MTRPTLRCHSWWHLEALWLQQQKRHCYCPFRHGKVWAEQIQDGLQNGKKSKKIFPIKISFHVNDTGLERGGDGQANWKYTICSTAQRLVEHIQHILHYVHFQVINTLLLSVLGGLPNVVMGRLGRILLSHQRMKTKWSKYTVWWTATEMWLLTMN